MAEIPKSPRGSASDSPLFPHPFSKAYWKCAASEFKKTNVLVFAALMIALRVAFKAFSIPIAADLRINTAFLINAFGAMVFGPVVAVAAAAITDTLGCLLFPTGPYFFPFILIEIAGSVIFALFLYRAEISVTRVILSRFCIDFFVNIVLQTPIMMLYYEMMMGKYYAPVDLVRILKNLALFPLESIVLTIFLRYAIPPVQRLGLVKAGADKLRFTRRNIIVLAVATVIGIAAVGSYYVVHYNTTSLSASYTAEERFSENERLNGLVLARHPDWAPEDTVTIIESAYPRFGKPDVTYSVAVYGVDSAAVAEQGADLQKMRGYSKSKAKADPLLTPLGTAVLQINRDTGEVTDYQESLTTP